MAIIEKSQTGSAAVQFQDSILYKLVGAYFSPVVPSNGEITLEIISELYASPLGGYLFKVKRLEKLKKRF